MRIINNCPSTRIRCALTIEYMKQSRKGDWKCKTKEESQIVEQGAHVSFALPQAERIMCNTIAKLKVYGLMQFEDGSAGPSEIFSGTMDMSFPTTLRIDSTPFRNISPVTFQTEESRSVTRLVRGDYNPQYSVSLG